MLENLINITYAILCGMDARAVAHVSSQFSKHLETHNERERDRENIFNEKMLSRHFIF